MFACEGVGAPVRKWHVRAWLVAAVLTGLLGRLVRRASFAFCVFFVDLVLQSTARRKFVYTFFWWLDLVRANATWRRCRDCARAPPLTSPLPAPSPAHTALRPPGCDSVDLN